MANLNLASDGPRPDVTTKVTRWPGHHFLKLDQCRLDPEGSNLQAIFINLVPRNWDDSSEKKIKEGLAGPRKMPRATFHLLHTYPWPIAAIATYQILCQNLDRIYGDHNSIWRLSHGAMYELSVSNRALPNIPNNMLVIWLVWEHTITKLSPNQLSSPNFFEPGFSKNLGKNWMVVDQPIHPCKPGTIQHPPRSCQLSPSQLLSPVDPAVSASERPEGPEGPHTSGLPDAAFYWRETRCSWSSFLPVKTEKFMGLLLDSVGEFLGINLFQIISIGWPPSWDTSVRWYKIT